MYIYGKNVVKETINSDTEIIKAYVSKKSHDQELIHLIQSKKIKVDFVDDYRLDKMVNGKHQGFILEVSDIKTYDIEELFQYNSTEYPTVVLLDHLEDPHNFGAIIRTCEAMGVMGIIIPKDRCVDINSTVVKTSTGAIQHIKIVRVANLNVAIKKLKEHGFWIIGTDMDGEDYQKIDYQMPICLVIGNEGHGMSHVVSLSCDKIAKIPMKGKVNSLNASVSCGMFLAMIDAQRNLEWKN